MIGMFITSEGECGFGVWWRLREGSRLQYVRLWFKILFSFCRVARARISMHPSINLLFEICQVSGVIGRDVMSRVAGGSTPDLIIYI